MPTWTRYQTQTVNHLYSSDTQSHYVITDGGHERKKINVVGNGGSPHDARKSGVHRRPTVNIYNCTFAADATW